MTRIPVADRRTALVQAALRVVARDGVAAASTRRIVGEAGMPLASFHYVFESRDELMAQLIEAGNLTPKDVQDAEKLLRDLSRKKREP